MIPVTGMSTQVALKLVDATRDQQIEGIEKSARHARAISHFRENIANVQSVDDLLEDYDTYAFVMRAFDLEDKIFGKAMMGKILESDISDRGALVNRLTDSRFRELHLAMSFEEGGATNPVTSNPAWAETIVDRYVEQQFINEQAEQNASLGTVLEFRRGAGEINSWFDVLKDKDRASFMRTALGIPDEVVQTDVDRQAEIFAKKYDITKLKDPAEVEKLVRKYTAITDVRNPPEAATSSVVTLMQGAVASAGNYVPVTIDIAAISKVRASYFR